MTIENDITCMRPGTVLVTIDDNITMVSDLQAEIHGLTPIWTFEETQQLAKKAQVPLRPYTFMVVAAARLVRRRMRQLEQVAETQSIWKPRISEWEQKCQEWKTQHQSAMERLKGPHGGGMTFA